MTGHFVETPWMRLFIFCNLILLLMEELFLGYRREGDRWHCFHVLFYLDFKIIYLDLFFLSFEVIIWRKSFSKALYSRKQASNLGSGMKMKEGCVKKAEDKTWVVWKWSEEQKQDVGLNDGKTQPQEKTNGNRGRPNYKRIIIHKESRQIGN